MVLPVAGQGLLERNALRAAGLRAIRPLAVRAQVMHLVAAALEPVTAERRSDRAADGGALRGAERGLLLLVEAHAGSAASRRQSAMTKFRIIMKIQSVACVGGKWGGEQSVAPGSFCVFAEAWRRSSRPDPGVVTRHPQGPGALRRIDTGAPGRDGKGGPEVSPVARSVADGVLFRLEAGGVFANPKALDTSRIHNKYTTSDSHAPNGTCKHCRINAESTSCVLRYNRTLKLAIIGYGNVGRALARLVRQKRQEFPFTIVGVHTLRHGTAVDAAGLPAEVLEAAEFGPRAASVEEFLEAARAQVAIELTTLNPSTGEPATGHIRAAMTRHMHVVTANKGPIAHAYGELRDLAARQRVSLRFESSVMDGAPVFNLWRHAMPGVKVLG